MLGEDEFDKKWNRVLHDGLLAGSELPEIVPELTAQPLASLADASTKAGASATGLEVGLPPLPRASRRALRQRRVVAGASRPAHQAHLGQPRAREPEDRREARSCERGCDPSRLRGALARASRFNPPRHGGRRGRLDARLWPFARGPNRLGRRVRHVQGSTLHRTWLRRRRHTHQARARVLAVGDPEPRQHGGAPARQGVDPDGAAIGSGLAAACSRERAWGGIAPGPERRKGVRPRRVRGGPASLFALEGAHLRSGPPVGDDDRP